MTLGEPTGAFRTATQAADLLFEAENGKVACPYVEPGGLDEARAAVDRLGQRFAQLPGAIRNALDAAGRSADLLSGDPLQGLSEIVQNADDVHATEVRFLLTDDALVVAHDGDPVTLSNVLALATPWLTTKTSESGSTGRFGIGLMTLHSLASTLEVHCDPYHVRLGEPTVRAIEPFTPPPFVAGPGWTVLRIPFDGRVLSDADLGTWLDRWDDLALLFLGDVERVVRLDRNGDTAQQLRLRWQELPSITGRIGATSIKVGRRCARTIDGRQWTVYTADPPSPPRLHRARKKAAKTTPMGVALPLEDVEAGVLYAGLPLAPIRLPVRANAQFDPLASRQGLAATAWNSALLPMVADLWSIAVLDLFGAEPRDAWRTVPVSESAESSSPGNSPESFEALLLDAARHIVAANLSFSVAEVGNLGIASLAVEEERLEGVLTAEEVAALAGLPAALPTEVRDDDGFWRVVLDDWRDAGAAVPPTVLVPDALQLLNEPERRPASVVPLVASGIDAGFTDVLESLPCIVTKDGMHVAPPRRDDELVLVAEEAPLVEELGIAVRLHPAFLTDSGEAKTVLEWLRKRGTLLGTGDVAVVVRRLATMGDAGHTLPSALTDAQAQAVRDAFEVLSAHERQALGPSIGRAVLLHGFTFDRRGRKQACTVRPAEAYLPKSLDREPDGFAEAAANAPGLKWIAGRYAAVLRSPTGRGGVGALRLLRLLGAETAPRLRRHPAAQRRFVDPRLGVPAAVGGAPAERKNSLERMDASFTLQDLDSPDLQVVIEHIASERGARRRRGRASALLGTLGRAWPDRLADLAVVTAAFDYVQWQVRGEMRAFWLWKAGGVAWLDDMQGVPRRPVDLRLRTHATVALYGADIGGYLHPDLDAPNRRPVLDALGVTGEPTTQELIGRLEALRRNSTDADTATGAAVVYQALAERIRSGGRGPGHLSLERIRAAFSRRPGLVHTPNGWKTPAQVLAGPPIFGSRRDFVPPVPQTERLWTVLRVPSPSIKDCVDVLGEMARRRQPPDAADQVIMLETLRNLALSLPRTEVDAALTRRLARLPLWTSLGWRSARPVYAIDDPPLADRLGSKIAVWMPGGSMEQFRGLIRRLRVDELSPADTEVVNPDDAEVDDELSGLFHSAIRLLREDLARNDPNVAQAITVTWDFIETMDVSVHQDLRVRVSGVHDQDVRETVEVNAKADVQRGLIFVSDPSLLPRAEGGGRAVAGLFTRDRRQVAQAWRTAWDEAEAGKRAAELVLASEQAAKAAAQTEADIEARTTAVREQIKARHRRGASEAGRSSKREIPKSTAGSRVAGGSTPTRTLVDPNALQLRDPKGRLVGSVGEGKGSKADDGRSSRGLAPPKRGVAGPRSHAAAPGYTAVSRETIGLDLVRRVLGSDADQIADLRAQHGVGADALDELDQFYELKVCAGPEPDRITLTDSEVQRALTEPGFFLVVVSEVEGNRACPKVRIIADPLKQLHPADTGSVTLTGVRDARSLVFEFEQQDEVTATVTT